MLMQVTNIFKHATYKGYSVYLQESATNITHKISRLGLMHLLQIFKNKFFNILTSGIDITVFN